MEEQIILQKLRFLYSRMLTWFLNLILTDDERFNSCKERILADNRPELVLKLFQKQQDAQ